MKAYALFCLLLLSSLLTAQVSPVVDSLNASLRLEKNDTEKVKTLNELAWEYSSLDLAKGAAYCQTSIALATQLHFLKGRGSAYNTLGNIHSDQGNNKEALNDYLLALKDKEAIKDEKGIATISSNIAILYRIASDSANALHYAHLALAKREKLHDQKGMGDCYNNIGNIYRSFTRFEEALQAFGKALAIRQTLGDKRGVAFTYNNLATVYDDRSNFILALDYNYRAAKLLEEINDPNSLARVYNNIGIINKKLGNRTDALKYSRMALALSEKTGNKSYRTSIYENMGGVYIDQKNYALAKSCYEQGAILAAESGDKELQAHFQSGLGLCAEEAGQQAEAESHLKKAIQIVEGTQSERDLVRYSNILADFYCRAHKKEGVTELLDRSIALSTKNGFPDERRKAYKIYARYYEDVQPDVTKSNTYYKRYSLLSDSLFSDDVSRKFAEQQVSYETEKKEREIQILKQQDEIKQLLLGKKDLELQQRKYLLYALILGILLLLFSGYVYVSVLRNRARLREHAVALKAEEAERMRIAKDIHDDLGSGLSKIKFLSEVVMNKAGADPEVRSGLHSISENAVHLVGNMKDLIWVMDPENTRLESLVARIREYSSDYLADFSPELILDIPDQIPSLSINKEAHRNIFFIVKESIHNIVKHAGANEVTLSLKLINETFLLTIADNGKGAALNENDKGNGLRNMRYRAEAIGGHASIQAITGKGLTVQLSIPFSKIARNYTA